MREPVRLPNQYQHLLRSIDAFDFSVSLDYSLTSQSARSLSVPPGNRQFIFQPNPARNSRADEFISESRTTLVELRAANAA